MRIVITGGAGFLGSHICERLHSEGNIIFCLDNFCTGRKKNIQHLLDKDYFYLIEHDICNPIPSNSLFGKIDQIYNLASPASPPAYGSIPIETFETNILGSINCLEFALKQNATVLFTSSSEVYGEALVHPQPESYWGNVNSVGPRSCYDLSKKAGETLYYDYNRIYGVKTKIVRLFNSFGTNMRPDDGRVVSNFILQSIKNEPITLYGDGSQTRSFCFVDDTINGLIKMINSDPSFIGPVNIGNPNEITINELAQTVIKLTNSKSEIEYRPLPQDDPTRRCPDILLAKEKLGWEPKVSLEDGLIKTIEYFRDTL